MPETRQLHICSFWIDGAWREPFDYEITGTPCESAVEQLGFVHVPENILHVYPSDKDTRFGPGVSYLGVALRDAQGAVLGLLFSASVFSTALSSTRTILDSVIGMIDRVLAWHGGFRASAADRPSGRGSSL
jgi:hypothetical protein